jgi:predicted N-acetyltransferase YhbS
VKASFRRYKPGQDFVRIRDMLVDTRRSLGRPVNWRIERWNYARYFVAPYLGDPSPAESEKNIRFWEEAIGVWENSDGEIVGVVNIEHPALWHPGSGEAFFQRHPQYDFLLGEMLDYAEANLVNREKNSLYTRIFDYDEPFQALVQERGYRKDMEHPGYDSEFVIEGDLPACQLPEGYIIRSMADENNLALRAQAFGLAFNHPEPKDWPTVATYAQLQKAPDYRKELDLYIVAPDGEYVSFCIVWYDEINRMGMLEPVGTHPDFRRRGLARTVVMESIRRAAALGAKSVWVGSDQEFYLAVGFQRKHACYDWTKEF